MATNVVDRSSEANRNAPTADSAHGRVPPHDLNAEQAILGAFLLNADALADSVGLITGEDFYRPAHQHVFEAAIRLYTKGEAVDAVTVHDELARNDLSEGIGGLAGLMELQSFTPVATNARYYAQIVKDRARLRRLIKASTEINELAYSLPNDVPAAMDLAESLIFAAANREDETDMKPVVSLLGASLDELEELYRRPSGLSGAATGFVDLDKKLNGLQPASLIILGARPSIGKTSLALDIAVSAAKGSVKAFQNSRDDTDERVNGNPPANEPLPVLFFSLEMSQSEVMQRLIAAEARVSTEHLRSGRINDNDWSKINKAIGRLGDLPLWFDDSPSMSVLEIRAKSRRRHSAAGGLALVVVDYLQLLLSNEYRRENRQVEVAEFSRNLKILARELNCPVLALSQLSRAPETRQDKRPMLADLRESGAIEQDADVVMFLYRDEVYHADSKDRGIAEINIAKHRSGPTGMIKLVFLPNYTKFVDAAGGTAGGVTAGAEHSGNEQYPGEF